MNFRQLLLSAITLCIAIYIPLVTAYAQVTKSPAPTDGIIPSAAPTPIDYQLPYPGMLPDNPLYFLKLFRDNLTSFFISKPEDKAKFDLMQSDKYVQASYLLATQQQGKTQLSFQTFSQAQDYFEQAILQAQNAKKQGYSTKEIADKLTSSNQKHEQILQAIAQSAHQEDSQIVKSELERVHTLSHEIKSL